MAGLQSKLKKGDEIIVISGKAKGQSGKIARVLTETNRVIVSGLMLAKAHLSARKAMLQQKESGIVQKELSIHASNVMLKDPKTGKPTKVAYKITAEGAKQRVAKKSGEVVDTIKKVKPGKGGTPAKAGASSGVTKAKSK